MADRSLHSYNTTFDLAEDTSLKQTEPNTEAGDYWLAEVKDDFNLWPVVICDEDMTKSLGMSNSRPESASRPNKDTKKYWRKPFRSGGSSVNKRSFPAMFLHSMKFSWIPWCDLKPLDIQMAEAQANASIKTKRSMIYKEVLEQYKRRNPKHWIDRLAAHRYNESLASSQAERVGGKSSEKRKWRSSEAFSHPCGYGDAVDDEESSYLPRGSSGQMKIKEEIKDERSSQEKDALYRDPEDDDDRYRKSSKLNSTARFRRPETSVDPKDNIRKLSDVKVKIYVGNPHEVLVVKKGGLEQSGLLRGLLTYDTREGWYVMAPLLAGVTAQDFKPVAEFLDYGEYRPNLLIDRAQHVRLEDIDTEQKRVDEMLCCGVVYDLADLIELPNLQRLVFRKIRALSSSFKAPFPSFELLTAVQLIFSDRAPKDLGVLNFFVKYIVDHFWDLSVANPLYFAKIMQQNEHLSRSVFSKLGEAPNSVGDIKAEEKTMEQEEDTAQDEKKVTRKNTIC